MIVGEEESVEIGGVVQLEAAMMEGVGGGLEEERVERFDLFHAAIFRTAIRRLLRLPISVL